MTTIGLLAAIGAILAWTIGDYSIEQSTRKFGNWKTILFVGIGGFLGLFPFIYHDLGSLFSSFHTIRLFLLLFVVSLFSALLLFEALKEGKLAIIEPVFGIELPVVILLSIIIGHERLNLIFYLLSALVFAGLILAVTTWRHLEERKNILERGVILAIIGSISMGVTDFLTGFSSRETSPLLTIWFLHSSIGLAAFLYLLFKGKFGNLIHDIRSSPKTIVSVAFFDNFAWVCYGYAMVYLPISIATTITESFIALVVLVGVFLNKEKLQRHQKIGVMIIIIAVLLLAYLVEY